MGSIPVGITKTTTSTEIKSACNFKFLCRNKFYKSIQLFHRDDMGSSDSLSIFINRILICNGHIGMTLF